MLRAVIFDLDDTLVDQKTAAAKAVVAWAADHDVVDGDVVSRWADVSEVNYARYQRRELSFTQQRRERVRAFLGVEVDDSEADELFGGYLRRYEARWSLFDDAVPALRRAKAAGLTVAVLTDGDEEHQRFKLKKLDITDEIDVVVASSMLPAGKPDPRAFAHAVLLVEVAADEAVMIGNSLDKDVRGALAAGLDAVLLDRHDSYSDVRVRRIRSLDDMEFQPVRGT